MMDSVRSIQTSKLKIYYFKMILYIYVCFCRPRWECNKCHKLLKREYVNEQLCAARDDIMSCRKCCTNNTRIWSAEFNSVFSIFVTRETYVFYSKIFMET